MSPAEFLTLAPRAYAVVRDWLKRRKELNAPERRIDLLLEDAWIYIDASDNGSIEVKCTIVNFSTRAWEVDHLEVSLWTVENFSGPNYPHWLTLAGSVSGRAMSSTHFSLKLGSPEVRHIIKSMKPVDSSVATRGTKLMLQGQVVFRSGTRMARVPILLESKSTNVHVDNNVITGIRQ